METFKVVSKIWLLGTCISQDITKEYLHMQTAEQGKPAALQQQVLQTEHRTEIVQHCREKKERCWKPWEGNLGMTSNGVL